MRKFVAATIVAALAIAPAFAATQAPLASGKPAGVHKAQLLEGNGLLFVAGAVVLGVAIAAATSQHDNQNVGVQGVTPPTST